jgi:hypothetical protein
MTTFTARGPLRQLVPRPEKERLVRQGLLRLCDVLAEVGLVIAARVPKSSLESAPIDVLTRGEDAGFKTVE